MSKTGRYLLCGVLFSLLVGCESRPTDKGQQYKDGHLTQNLQEVASVNSPGVPVNGPDFLKQVEAIRTTSPRLYNQYSENFRAVENWLRSGADTAQLRQFNLHSYQMEGKDNYGNVQFTGYYTPVVQARHTRQGEFQYPIYRMPPKKGSRLPSRAQIYNGALSDNYVLAYSNSLMDNFLMDVQGSAYIDFGDGSELNFFAYAGKNGHGYTSIGRVLIDRGEVEKKEMSMLAIRQWADNHSPQEVQELLEQNASFVFFTPKQFAPVKGASAVPLIAKASVASDKTLIPPGTTLLAEVPVLDNQGNFTGRYDMRLMIALDVGGAIKGHHFDIYHGIGHDAGLMAGFYNHYGRVWVLKKGIPPILNPAL
ncbi:murein transglycosylase A [Morganella morganii]|uniref:murein transglycosylase A n=1 Tax=Morganella morganii TaxID=582 RepID=UPI0007DB89B0|nr:murein transglycosylase A [Morganella morganii]HDS7362873.1 murein transglycosylase A [Morganella morganii subsp. morganii]OAR99355.1 murein transglycosylase [Morganella morganii]UEH03495.1 murein transglycosylase A [Morganella morganii]WNJ22932.1 murein transglycosylase A [Morganella morganii]HEO9696475.1 murein transglycosylase A [Morganella morganii subsp. morganii]